MPYNRCCRVWASERKAIEDLGRTRDEVVRPVRRRVGLAAAGVRTEEVALALQQTVI